MDVRFWGVRGSTPCSGPSLQRYGGNTSCVEVARPGAAPIIFDTGTGIRALGGHYGCQPGFEAHVFVTHLHWDHVQGLPFFMPLHHPTSDIAVYGPPQPDRGFDELFHELMRPPFFPITPEHLPGRLQLCDGWNNDVTIGSARVKIRSVPHCGETNGYRVDYDGVSVAYISDHQECLHDPGYVADSVLELCDGVDLLIHDAQFDAEELAQRSTWGHCTPRYAVEVAAQAGVGHLMLFHHDPWHDDTKVDSLLAEAVAEAADRGVRTVTAAHEGLVVHLERH